MTMPVFLSSRCALRRWSGVCFSEKRVLRRPTRTSSHRDVRGEGERDALDPAVFTVASLAVVAECRGSQTAARPAAPPFDPAVACRHVFCERVCKWTGSAR